MSWRSAKPCWRAPSRKDGSPSRIEQWADQISLFVPRHLNLVLDRDVRLRLHAVAQIRTDSQSIEPQRVANPAVRHLRRVQLSCRRCDPLQAVAIGGEVRGYANARRRARAQGVHACRLPVNLADKSIRRHIGETDTDGVAVRLPIQ